MRRLGTFAELWDGESEYESIRDAVGILNEVERRRVAFYLVRATSIRYTIGFQSDVIDGEEVFLTSGLRSDGSWYWRTDLAHYVLKYGVRLPIEFLDEARSNLWGPPSFTEQEAATLASQIEDPS